MNIDRLNNTPQWSGYTLDEIQYKRGIVQTRITVTKDIITMRASQLYNDKFGFRTSSKPSMLTSMLSRAVSAFSMMDYAVLSFKAVRSVMRTMRRFR